MGKQSNSATKVTLSQALSGKFAMAMFIFFATAAWAWVIARQLAAQLGRGGVLERIDTGRGIALAGCSKG